MKHKYKGKQHTVVRRKWDDGYIMLVGPYQSWYRLEHRVVMEKKLGRKLYKHETVHHKNGKRADNRLSNLELWSNGHPYGQRVSDLLKFAKWVLRTYGEKK